MLPSERYEIFQQLPQSEPAWVENATGFENAVNRSKELMQTSPADYFVLERGSIKYVTQSGVNPDEKEDT
jgi:hypothetical protein